MGDLSLAWQLLIIILLLPVAFILVVIILHAIRIALLTLAAMLRFIDRVLRWLTKRLNDWTETHEQAR